TFGSGPVIRGAANTSNFGLVQSGALEGSNVDITAQLVNMITAQRSFQANAQAITTFDQITQTIINIR
ncbi:flagellar basal body rod C-terminal domain-containing protein, partial [Acinetobacter baumannii]